MPKKYKREINENGEFVITCPNCLNTTIYTRRSGKPDKCPYCQDLFYDKQYDEYTLFKLQEKFHNSKTKEEKDKYLAGIYNIVLDYSKKVINSILTEKSKGIKLTPYQMDDAAFYCASRTIEYYLKKPDWGVRLNFYQFLRGPAMESLFKFSKEEKNHSINYQLDNEGNEAKHYLYDTGDMVEKFYSKYDRTIIIELIAIVHKSIEIIQENFGYSHSIRVLNGVKFYLQKINTNFMENYFEYYGDQVREHTDQILLLIRKHLKSMVYIGELK